MLLQRLKPYKKITTYRAGGQREAIETLGEVVISKEKEGEEDVVFAIDCEPMLESALENKMTTAEGEDEDW
jgi:hypothetical protein